ncbi:beta-mannosidase [Arthrobacter alpinus]|nr:beta-mannosidase [Arthrobacter alpinus]
MSSAGGCSWELRPTTDVPAEAALGVAGIPAVVPGEVHTDLLRAGLIPDPFDGNNESALAWIGLTDWQYRTVFTFSDAEHARHDLVADGLDTAATIRLNGKVVASTANQHRSYRFDVRDFLVQGENELVIDFRAPVTFAREQREMIGDRPHTNHHPFNAVRKMACSFGWDWGIDIAGAGIWKAIRLESWTGARIASVRPLATLDAAGTGVLETHVELEWDGGPAAAGTAELSVSVAGVAGNVTVGSDDAVASLVLQLPEVAPWWPRGHGEQALHEVRVELSGVGNDSWSSRVGFRIIEVVTEADHDGTSFKFRVNGVDVYIRGANWIPDDALITRITRESLASSIGDAVESGMNLLRVWGGGMYESEDFYDICDEQGLLVWQDFLFACAAYSEEEPLRSEVIAEAREAVTRLSKHASLALWNGCNENIWGWVEWDWRVPLAGRTWGEGYYRQILPEIVGELDARTRYSSGSPFSYGDHMHPNDPRHGTIHIWDVWNQKDYTHYASYQPRFASEFGFQGPPAWSTLTSVVHDEPLAPYGEQMLVHQKADQGNLKLERGLGEHLPVPELIEDWHWATQLNQARALVFGIEHFRSLFPLNQGTVMWQLNDSWPVVSWAAVDSHGIRKPLWHALKHVYAPRLATVQPREGGLAVVLHNDTDAPLAGALRLRRMTTAGELLAEEPLSVSVPARSAETYTLPEAIARPGDATAEYIQVRAEDAGLDVAAAFGYFVEDTALALVSPAQALSASAKPTDDGVAVTVRATALVKDIALFPDRLDAAASVDSGLITLSAGEEHTFFISGSALDMAALVTAPVLRCANDLLHG